jgi:uncharacterized membrane protein YczE
VLQSNFWFRLIKLLVGLFIYGIGVALLVHAAIGIAPWDVLAQGISLQTGISFGQATVVVSLIVMLMWIPLKVRVGLGSVLNAILIGLFADIVLAVLPPLEFYWQQVSVFVAGLLIVAYATGLYISCGMGKGPRDGLMLGLATKLQRPFWQVRTGVEIVVVTAGFLLGGQVREGTLLFALSIGYLNQLSLRFFGLADRSGRV